MDNAQHIFSSHLQQNQWDDLAKSRAKWTGFIADFLRPIGDKMIEKLDLKDKSRILDLAAGTGELGMRIARKLKKGIVVAADISGDMLLFAANKALDKNIYNYITIHCDSSRIPMMDDSFNGAVCRNGFMFFENLEISAKELFRIVKPDACVTISVWGLADKNSIEHT